MSRYGDEARNLILAAICGLTPQVFAPMSLLPILARQGLRRRNCANWVCYKARLPLFSTALIFRIVMCSATIRRNISSFFAVAT
jgi:hypothetical protein